MGEETGEYRSRDAMRGVAPEPTYGPAVTIEVDGEVFESRPDGHGGTHYDWVSGPNKDYGFTVSPTEGGSLEDHRESIRDFLGQIDPATGFMGD